MTGEHSGTAVVTSHAAVQVCQHSHAQA